MHNIDVRIDCNLDLFLFEARAKITCTATSILVDHINNKVGFACSTSLVNCNQLILYKYHFVHER